jgi:hypothetical protein
MFTIMTHNELRAKQADCMNWHRGVKNVLLTCCLNISASFLFRIFSFTFRSERQSLTGYLTRQVQDLRMLETSSVASKVVPLIERSTNMDTL